MRVWGVETAGADAMSRALAAGGPVPISADLDRHLAVARRTSRRSTYAHVGKLVEDVLVVSDAEALVGARLLAERAKVWAEPAAGCLLPAAARLLPRLGPGAAARAGALRRQRHPRRPGRLGIRATALVECCAVFLHGAALTGAQR